MGVLGDEEETGKPVGDDLREGKPTSLVAAAFERANQGQLDILKLIGSQDLTDTDISDIQNVIIETEAQRVIEEEIRNLTDSALSELESASLDAKASDALRELALFVAYRTY